MRLHRTLNLIAGKSVTLLEATLPEASTRWERRCTFPDNGIHLVLWGDEAGRIHPIPIPFLNFSTVATYDIASANWYDQETSGNIPEDMKESHSTDIASANNTYKILVYARWNGHLGPVSVPYDEAYILSFPAFPWFKAPYPTAHPRRVVSCVPVGCGQIMTVGRVDSTSLQCLTTTPSMPPIPLSKAWQIST